MHDRAAAILARTSTRDLAQVAAGVLGESVADPGPISYTEITAPHSEGRTVVIIRVAGHALGRPWSSVVKALDMSVPPEPRHAGFTAPETEEVVYEEGYFTEAESGLRPARCYLVSRPPPTLKLLWLEDLTSAQGPPFALHQLDEMAHHLGRWNGRHAPQEPPLNFPLLRNAFDSRFKNWSFEAKLKQLAEIEDHPMVRGMYKDHSLAVAGDFVEAMSRLSAWGRTAPGTLAYGDCSAGNLFHRPGETIGIDWASLTLDPTGVDGGCLIGSSITWGPRFVDVARNERRLFDSYLESLQGSDWEGNPGDVRRGYFCLFGFYVGATLTIPLNVLGTDQFLARSFLEKRYGMVMEEIPEAANEIVDLVPDLTREINALLGETT